jgi:DNA-binding transcriptional LysR family regulator
MQVKNVAVLGQLSDADLRLLRVFKCVVECGGMVAAELELNIAISTISRHIKDLETRLGLVLCRRGRSGFALTPEGTQVYEAALNLLSATDAFRNQLHDIHQRLGGDLHVAVFEKTASNPQSHIDKALARFRTQVPEARLHLHVGPIGAIERGVIDGQYHLGIIPEHRNSESLSYQALFDETMLLYAGQGHPWFESAKTKRNWKDLQDQALAALGYHSPNMALAHLHRLERSASASDQEAVAMLVMSGEFVGFLPDHYAEPFVRNGQMCVVSPKTLRYDCRFSAIMRQSPKPLRLTEAFFQVLCEVHDVKTDQISN